jgi:hypothetical protein
MPKPEKTIAGFLLVWENNPELFLAAGVEKDLDSLNTAITSSRDAANEDIAKQIQDWCKKHSNVRDVVRVALKKFDPSKNFPTRPEEDRTLDNRYPEISQVLRDKSQEKEVKSGET